MMVARWGSCSVSRWWSRYPYMVSRMAFLLMSAVWALPGDGAVELTVVDAYEA
jgi:hypothetical protein